MLPFLKKIVSSCLSVLVISITPPWVDSIFFITLPLESICAEIPLFEDLIILFPSSIDLKIEWTKCWCGPTELPNHPSSEILTIKLKFESL